MLYGYIMFWYNNVSINTRRSVRIIILFYVNHYAGNSISLLWLLLDRTTREIPYRIMAASADNVIRFWTTRQTRESIFPSAGHSRFSRSTREHCNIVIILYSVQHTRRASRAFSTTYNFLHFLTCVLEGQTFWRSYLPSRPIMLCQDRTYIILLLYRRHLQQDEWKVRLPLSGIPFGLCLRSTIFHRNGHGEVLQLNAQPIPPWKTAAVKHKYICRNHNAPSVGRTVFRDSYWKSSWRKCFVFFFFFNYSR